MKLDSNTIQVLANCTQITAFVQFRIVTWNSTLDEWSKHNVEQRNVELDKLCQPSVLKDYLIWADQVTYPQISAYCRRLDGVLPEVKDLEKLQEVHDSVYER